MVIEPVAVPLSVCKVTDYAWVDLNAEFCFTGHTNEERSLVCPTHMVPPNTTARDDGWRAFRIRGELDFSTIGIMSSISSRLAQAGIGLFAISTYNTDYVLVRADDFERALAVLRDGGYAVAWDAAPLVPLGA
ncbi:MAG: ACT domain-containing protein [Bifidobacterium sp.]|nr:ACT domain-containing protein [Bifidobacterium sp.]